MSEPVKIIVAGCGARGTTYSQVVKSMPERAVIVGVAEPRDFYRNQIGDLFNIPEERRYRDWKDMAAVPKFADAVFICTMDYMHKDPVVAFAGLGYNIMVEKPLAPNLADCKTMVKAVKDANIIFAVCHVLRYTKFTQMLKKELNDGAVGDLVSVQHLEPVGYWHQCHSFVRGNWRNEEETSSMLLQKCCHDLDWLRYMFNVPCLKVQSFGSLKHFKKANQPAGAADRCVNCPAIIESRCPYSALKIYMRDGGCLHPVEFTYWPTNVLTTDMTEEGVLKAIQEGPYGRCVYACDNDVVDHQVVNMLFEGERTASMTMTAFTMHGGRRTQLFGTKGSIDTDSRYIHVSNFLTNQQYTVDTEIDNDGGIGSGHGGGDNGVVTAFIKAIENHDQSCILSGTDESLESHEMVFAAEESRKTGKICDISGL